jgi:fluoroacetyl-CoA thioesterase
MGDITPGITNELVVDVTPEITARHLGSGSAAVLATPYMISLMEKASQEMVAPLLPPEQSTVGVLVNVRHLAATPLGMQVRIRSELVAVDGRRLTFKVEAFDAVDKCGEGTHERMIIDIARFEDRLRRKKEAAGQT